MPDAEAIAGSIIEQAKLQGGGRVSGHWEKVRAGQAGRRIIEEAQDMRAAAVVLALPAARLRALRLRQDARDGARRAAVPRDHRVAAAAEAPAQGPRARSGDGMSPAALALSSLLVVIGLAIVVRTIAAGGGPLATGIVLGLLFVAAGAGRIWAERRR